MRLLPLSIIERTAAKRTIAFDRRGRDSGGTEGYGRPVCSQPCKMRCVVTSPRSIDSCNCSTATQHRLQQNIAEIVCLNTCRRRCGAVALELTAARPRPGRRREYAVQKIAWTRSKKMQKMVGIRRMIGYRNGGSTSTTRRLLRRGSRWTRRKGRGPMIRKVVCIGALVAASTNLVVVLSSAGVAGAVPPPATGTAICKIAYRKWNALAGADRSGDPRRRQDPIRGDDGGRWIVWRCRHVPVGGDRQRRNSEGTRFLQPGALDGQRQQLCQLRRFGHRREDRGQSQLVRHRSCDRPHQGGLQEQHRYRRGVGHGHRHPQRSKRDCGQVRFVHHPEQPAPARSRDQYSGANVLWDHFDLLHTSGSNISM